MAFDTCSSAHRPTVMKTLLAKELRENCPGGDRDCINEYIPEAYKDLPLETLQDLCRIEHPCNSKNATKAGLIESIMSERLIRHCSISADCYRETLATLVAGIAHEYNLDDLRTICSTKINPNGGVTPESFKREFPPSNTFFNKTRSNLNSALSHWRTPSAKSPVKSKKEEQWEAYKTLMAQASPKKSKKGFFWGGRRGVRRVKRGKSRRKQF